MSVNEQEIWLQTIDSLKKEANGVDVPVLEELIFSGIKDSVVHITVSNGFIKDLIKERFSERLTALLQEHFNQHLGIVFTVQDQENADLPRKPSEKADIQAKPVIPAAPAPRPVKTASAPSSPERAEPRRSGESYPQNLNNEYTFDTFIPDQSTKFAFAAAQAISRNPGRDIRKNPLFIYGGVGVGKTHLMQSIGNYAYTCLNSKIVFVPSESFLNDFVESTRSKNSGMTIFRNKYRKADILLIDDIHLIKASAVDTQEELFNTINALTNSKKQLVFTCDRPASELKELTDRLKSRLGQGTQVTLQMPSFEARCAILEKHSEKTSIEIPREIIHFICDKISSNVRDLLAAFNKIVNYGELLNEPITLSNVQEQLKEYITLTKQANISIESIQKAVAQHFSLTVKDILGDSHKKNIVSARHHAMYLARVLTELSYEEIGGYFNGKHHTSILHACEKIESSKKLDPQQEITIQELTRTIKGNTVK